MTAIVTERETKKGGRYKQTDENVDVDTGEGMREGGERKEEQQQ